MILTHSSGSLASLKHKIKEQLSQQPKGKDNKKIQSNFIVTFARLSWKIQEKEEMHRLKAETRNPTPRVINRKKNTVSTN